MNGLNDNLYNQLIIKVNKLYINKIYMNVFKC